MEDTPVSDAPPLAAEGTATASTSGRPDEEPKPTVVIVIGMAGSGKTTLMQRLNAHLRQHESPAYIVNLDPAVTDLPYGPNIDIRDTVAYKSVMAQYNLGPNGGILTSCNLFATRFDQVMQLLEKKRDPPLDYALIDTPGQIEIFTWSASGQIITELLAGSFPTVIAYVVDTPRCISPQTFMSNMLQACSILYKTQLPLLLVFNKVDITRHEFALTWMKDADAYGDEISESGSYAASLSRSLSLVLDEFYENLEAVGVSALTGEGMDEFFEAIEKCSQEYEEHYKPMIAAKVAAKAAAAQAAAEDDMKQLQKDLNESGGGKVVLSAKAQHRLNEEFKEKAALDD